MNKKITLALCASALLFTQANANGFGVEVGEIKNKLDTNFKYGSAVTSTVISGGDIGLKKSDTSVKPTLYYSNDNHKVSFDYEKMDFGGSKVLTKNIEFNGKTYNVSDNVTSTMKFDWYRLGYEYSLTDYLYAGLDLHIIKADIGLQSNTVTERYSKTIPVPALVLGSNIKLNQQFGLEVKASGIKAGSKVTYTNYYAGANMKCALIENATWRVGYQYKKIDMDVNKVDGYLKFKGMYLGLNYKF